MSFATPPSLSTNPFATAASSPTVAIAAMGGGGADPSTLDDKSKIIGITLAVGSGLLIGSSFVFKKKGLLNCTKDGMVAGEGYAYLKSAMWWTGMLISKDLLMDMVAGEVCNFVAYAFVPAILVTPLGALSVVICAILSSIFLKERLNMQGKVGCALCIFGAVVIVLHAPQQAAMKTIEQFRDKMIQPGFLAWMGIIIVTSLILVFKVAPKWGKENMMVDISICSLIGSLSVVATQGLGAAIVHNISTGEPQFTNWFTYFVIVFVVVTLLIEINYLNKALNLFNTAMVTPTYYVTFTSMTILTSAILSQGFDASPVAIITVILGFLVICAGILLLQTSKPVVPVIVQDGKVSEVLGSVYDDFEPNAADLRASPFSSIRHFSRDLRHSTIVPTIHQYQPTGSRAESILQRKRRASNAALSHRSRPASMVSSLSPVFSDSASASGISTALHQTLVMGVEGRQVRLQLCEIVVSDEHNGTTRYPVYKPIVTGAHTLAPPPPRITSNSIPPVAAHSRPASSLFNHTFLAPRTSMMTAESQYSTVRFIDRSRRPSIAYPEDHSASMHDESLLEKIERQSIDSMGDFSPESRQHEGVGDGSSSISGYRGGAGNNHHPSRPLSGSMFWPPVIEVSPSPRSGPLKVGGSFFLRPRQQHGPSHLATSTIAGVEDDEGGSRTDEGGESEAGSTSNAAPSKDDEALDKTLVSIEVCNQPQPILAPYMPPPPSTGLPLPAPGSASSSTSSTSATTTLSPSTATSTAALVATAPSPSPIRNPVGKRRGVLSRLFGGSKHHDAESLHKEHEEHLSGSSDANAIAAATDAVTIQVDAPTANGTEHPDNEKSAQSPALHNDNDTSASATTTTHLPASSQQQQHPHSQSHSHSPGHVFGRIHHPQRISEGEEEEDEEDTQNKSSI
ncbi:hypothetical protein BGZ73_007539 [Actinomortierella ambigua]|nr:hypothetical protein BGZ73_007539 [Actinomortierella ambigua]